MIRSINTHSRSSAIRQRFSQFPDMGASNVPPLHSLWPQLIDHRHDSR